MFKKIITLAILFMITIANFNMSIKANSTLTNTCFEIDNSTQYVYSTNNFGFDASCMYKPTF